MTGLFALAPIIPALPNLFLYGTIGVVWFFVALSSLLRPRFWLFVIRYCVHQWRPMTVLCSVGGCSWLIIWSVGKLPSNEPDLVVADVSWPMARGGLRRFGAEEGATGPKKLSVTWQFRPGQDLIYSSPTVAEDRVYVVGNRGNRARIYCLNREDGSIIWDAAPRTYRTTVATPVLSHNLLFCGEGVHITKDARLVCLDPRKRGAIVWTLRTQGHVECTPVVAWPYVYVGAGDDGIYCVDATQVSNGQPKVVWHAKGIGFPDAESALIVHQDRVYAGLGIGGNALSILNAITGEEIKRLHFPHPLFAPPAIHRGKLFVGMGVGDMVTPVRVAAGQVCCIDLATLEVDWRCELPGSVLGAIVAADDGLVFGCWDGKVYRVSYQGRIVDQWDSRSPIISSVAVTESKIFGISTAGGLFAINGKDWREYSELELNNSGLCWSAPVVHQGQLFVGTEHNGLLCLGQRDQK